jgi:hypothetical protein
MQLQNNKQEGKLLFDHDFGRVLLWRSASTNKANAGVGWRRLG